MKTTALVIRCANCGGAMSPDQKSRSMVCPYCGHRKPWSPAAEIAAFKHRRPERVETYIKLGRVEILSAPRFHDEGVLSREYRTLSVEEKLERWDATTSNVFAAEFRFWVECPMCGAKIDGLSTQNLLKCEHCGNNINLPGLIGRLKPNAYRRELIMGAGAEAIPGKGIPFRVKFSEARQSVAEALRGLGMGENAAREAAEYTTANYIPFTPADIQIKAKLHCEKGNFQAFGEILNWVIPDTTLFDIFLLDRLDPWDFRAYGSFDPAFEEGVFRVASVSNNASRPEVIDNLLYDRIPKDFQKAFSLRTVEMEAWSRNVNMLSSGTFLPVYYYEKYEKAGQRIIRVAVNGQTGKSVVLTLDSGKAEYAARVPAVTLSPESTVRVEPKPVRYVKSPFLYEVVRLEDAMERGGFTKLFHR